MGVGSRRDGGGVGFDGVGDGRAWRKPDELVSVASLRLTSHMNPSAFLSVRVGVAKYQNRT